MFAGTLQPAMQAAQTRVVFDILDRLSSARTTQRVVDILKGAVRTLAGADGAACYSDTFEFG